MKSRDEIREICRKALKTGKYAEVGREYGLPRQAVWKYLDTVLDDPEARYEEAKKEVKFRKEVLEMVD